MRKCAYCEKEAELTREHIVPSFLYRLNPDAKFGYHPHADTFLKWEAQIKDVCTQCNNGPLSKVDAYAKRFFEENGVHNLVTTEKTSTLRYDFQLLSRMLLKITYNCLRFKNEQLNWLRPFREYILQGVNSPSHLKLDLGVEVVPCYKIQPSDRRHMPTELANAEYLPPHMFRMGTISGLSSDRLFCRYVAVNNFVFVVIISSKKLGQRRHDDALEELASVIPDLRMLNRHRGSTIVEVSRSSALDRYEATANALMPAWKAYLAKQN